MQKLNLAGIQAVAVGLGRPEHAQRYCGKLAPSLTCFVDAETEAYAAYGLAPGTVSQLAHPQTFLAAARAVSRGHTQGAATGDTKMLGGTFLVDTQGIIRAVHYDRHPGDHPDLDQLLSTGVERRLNEGNARG
jgi:peroxiredoxin